jgi:Peptidase inhibitor family I36
VLWTERVLRRKTLSMVLAGIATSGVALLGAPTAAFADSSCTLPQFCTFSGTNYTGLKGTSTAAAGVCYHDADGIRSIKNDTLWDVRYYSSIDCDPNSVNRATISSLTNVANTNWIVHSWMRF